MEQKHRDREESRDATKAPPPPPPQPAPPPPPQPLAERPSPAPAPPTSTTPNVSNVSSVANLLSKQPVKSILKQPSVPSAMPPSLESPASAGFLPSTTGRKRLLDSPPIVHPPPMRMPPALPQPLSSTAPSSTAPPSTASPLTAPSSSEQPGGGYGGADFWGNEAMDDQIIRSPDDTSIRSPDQSGFTIDETIRSPIGSLNTSKDSGDRSPELKIVENE